jgi:membrane-bound lytic murein transglycosylase B
MNRTQNQTSTAPLADLTPADILRCAARYLQTHGWIQGNHYQPNTIESFPPACALGAIDIAIYGHRNAAPNNRTEEERANWRLLNRTTAHLAAYLWDAGSVTEHDYYGGLCCSDREIVSDWNDEDGHDLAVILDILTSAADEYDWTHATEDDLETYAEHEYANERLPTREGFIAWLGAR